MNNYMEKRLSWEASFLSDTPTVSALYLIEIHGRVTREHLWSTSWASFIHCTQFHAVSVRSVKTVPRHLNIGIWTGLL